MDQMRELVEFWLARLQDKARDATEAAEWTLVLGEIEADRRPFRQYEDALAQSLVHGGTSRGEVTGLEYAIRCRVAVRADHPDYRTEWAPAT